MLDKFILLICLLSVYLFVTRCICWRYALEQMSVNHPPCESYDGSLIFFPESKFEFEYVVLLSLSQIDEKYL